MNDLVKEYTLNIDKKVKNELLNKNLEEKQVIVHVVFTPTVPTSIRIWPSTFLLDHHSDHKSKLIHHENIPLCPIWKHVQPFKTTNFTLYFSPLPRHCTIFDLREIIPEENGYEIFNIARNSKDIYYLNVD